MKRTIQCLLLALAIASPALAQSSAARAGDLTTHGGVIIGPGVPTVNIGGLPAAVVGDQISCPLVSGPVPHIGGPIVTGSTTVRIGGQPAARVGDLVVENGPSSTILVGALTVNIGP
jgi:uncharacterized Zn-binding protein involved in type VI secretion